MTADASAILDAAAVALEADVADALASCTRVAADENEEALAVVAAADWTRWQAADAEELDVAAAAAST